MVDSDVVERRKRLEAFGWISGYLLSCSTRISYILRTKLCYCCEAWQSLLCCTAFKRFGFKRLAAIACDHALLISLLCLLWEGEHDTLILFTRSHPQAIIWSSFLFLFIYLFKFGNITNLIGPDTMHLVACVAGTKRRGGGGEKGKSETPISHPLSLSPNHYPFWRLLCRLRIWYSSVLIGWKSDLMPHGIVSLLNGLWLKRNLKKHLIACSLHFTILFAVSPPFCLLLPLQSLFLGYCHDKVKSIIILCVWMWIFIILITGEVLKI